MGGIVRGLFGGSKSNSKSDNQAFPFLQQQLGGNIGMGNSAMGTLAGLLGIGDPSQTQAAQGTLQNFLDSTGFKFLLDTGSRAITGNNASKGLLRSGATGQRLQQFGQDLGMTKINELTDKLTSLGSYGLNSANTIAGAGARSTSRGSSQNGIFNSLFPGGLSDERTKNIIRQRGRLDNGLAVYEFTYKGGTGERYIGVIAQDVERVKPEALGPRTHDGFLTVNYDALEALPDLPFGRIMEEAE